MVKMQYRKMPKWKAPGKVGVQGYWLKNLTSLYPLIAVQLNHILGEERPLPDWMIFGKTVLCQKDPEKGCAVDYYRSIFCFPLTGMLAEKMYSHLERENVLASEQNGCGEGSPGRKDQLLIDKTVSRDWKRHTNLAVACINYKNAYDTVPHSWISECLDMFGIANNGQDFLNNSTKS